MDRTWRRLSAPVRDLLAATRYVDGSEVIDIPRLISPLRYDVLVRKYFFDLLEVHREMYERDFEAFMQIARRCPYYVWFEEVHCRRFDPALLKSGSQRQKAYRERVRASAQLYFSFSKHGLLPQHKIILRSGRKILPSESGKPVSARIFPGDGCHRLALLLKTGARILRPEQYRVKVTARYTPLDNTKLLLDALYLAQSEYAAFVSASFSERVHDRLEDLLDDVATHLPHRLVELQKVISADWPSLDAGMCRTTGIDRLSPHLAIGGQT